MCIRDRLCTKCHAVFSAAAVAYGNVHIHVDIAPELCILSAEYRRSAACGIALAGVGKQQLFRRHTVKMCIRDRFNAPLFGIAGNLEPDNRKEKYRTKLVSKKSRIILYVICLLYTSGRFESRSGLILNIQY